MQIDILAILMQLSVLHLVPLNINLLKYRIILTSTTAVNMILYSNKETGADNIDSVSTTAVNMEFQLFFAGS